MNKIQLQHIKELVMIHDITVLHTVEEMIDWCRVHQVTSAIAAQRQANLWASSNTHAGVIRKNKDAPIAIFMHISNPHGYEAFLHECGHVLHPLGMGWADQLIKEAAAWVWALENSRTSLSKDYIIDCFTTYEDYIDNDEEAADGYFYSDIRDRFQALLLE